MTIDETSIPTDRDRVEDAVRRARHAARWWGGLSHDDRKDWLLEFKSVVARNSASLVDVVREETGKPADDALLEVILAVEHLTWAAKNARRVLRERSVLPGLVSANQAASVRYEPMGVVGVIGPWNYPVYTPMGSIAYSMAAGNAVVFKPSELTPRTGAWLADTWDSLSAPHPVLQTVVGDGAVGAHLARAGVDKVAFTGSTATAKKVMATCAESLTPIVVEGGGKDALIVDEGADLDAAAEFAAFGAMGNAGQTCAGVERVYVVDALADRFVDKLVARVTNLRVGDAADAQYGRMTLPRQVDVVRSQVEDALARGGRAVVGGPESVRPPYVDPVVLLDVPEDSEAQVEETFGPTVVVNRVRDLDEAIDRANTSKYGLGASVFTGSDAAGRRAADRLRVGVVSINSVLGFAAIGALPFGGVGDSGFGRIHGADGLREFSRVKSVTRQRFSAPLNLVTMTRKRRDVAVARFLLTKIHGRRRR
ncbi:aldehyde dehydrogenase family protein [Rhodococcoides corynebacterioides]|uniref:aldehyde dehydrogenase family protein n=1 Tax=Rhodococcoides corynebacterioides TaxID=53972 RepID=UPI001C9B3AC2|nr:aldehyde dehydrogenase family protein [Rhodococcus corynebacterioides]MBY6363599.1 aldehyde dehydrogenase family protein [Rhodococcus corynebacterioides]